MADEIRKEVIVDVTVSKAENEQQVDRLTQRLHALQKETEGLVKTNKQLAEQGKQNSKEYLENARQIEINKQKISDNTASRKGLIQTLIAEDNSIKALRVRNAELIKQRDLIGTKTETGKRLISELNKEIDANNEIITANSSKLEKQRFNIGNYASALDRVIPGIGNFTNNIQQATVASKAFISTGLGLVLTALSLVLVPLISYLTSTGDGMDIVDKESAKWKATITVLKDEVSQLGREMFGLADGESSPFGKVLKGLVDANPLVIQLRAQIALLAKAFPDLSEKIEQNREAAANAAEQMDALNEAEQIHRITTAGLKNEIDQLILQSKDRTKTEEERLRLIDLVENKEESLVASEKKFAQQRLAIRVEELMARFGMEQRYGQTVEEFYVDLAKKLQSVGKEQEVEDFIKLIQQVEEAESASIKILEKLQNQENALLDKQSEERKKRREQELKELEEFQQAVQDINNEYRDREQDALNEIEILELERKARELEGTDEHQQALIDIEFERYQQSLENTDLTEAERELIYQQYIDRLAEIQTKSAKDREDREKKTADKLIANERALFQTKVGLVQQAADFLNAIAGKNKFLAILAIGIEKAAALAQIISNTAIANAKAVAASPLTFGQPWVSINTASGILSGATVVAEAAQRISEIGGFARGGKIKSEHGKSIQRSNGDNRLITAYVGEAIITPTQQSIIGEDNLRRAGVPGFATGGIITGSQTRAVAEQINQTVNLTPVVDGINAIKVAVILQDFEAKQEEKNAPIIKARVI